MLLKYHNMSKLLLQKLSNECQNSFHLHTICYPNVIHVKIIRALLHEIVFKDKIKKNTPINVITIHFSLRSKSKIIIILYDLLDFLKILFRMIISSLKKMRLLFDFKCI